MSDGVLDICLFAVLYDGLSWMNDSRILLVLWLCRVVLSWKLWMDDENGLENETFC